ncbi:PLP-dependent transferase [Mycena kentingensis (nom. inval.)]|nr:PLP-dependent transferase [Mycena kentingensis (nom. inval.)]
MVPPTNLEQVLDHALSSRSARGAPVSRLLVHSHPSGDFTSNDYLSLSSAPQLKEIFLAKLSQQGRTMGSTGSRFIAGNSPGHVALADRLKAYFRAPAALLVNSGFDANLGVLKSLPQKGDVVVYDQLVHESAREGISASRATTRIAFKHNDVGSLREVLVEILDSHPAVKSGHATVFVVVEGLYSMNGDVAPLRDIVDVVKEHIPQAARHLIIDEAHSTGIYGPGGRGLAALLGLEDEFHTRVHTFGKAMGVHGAVVLCSPTTRFYLANYAKNLLFTTSMPLYSLAAIDSAFDMLESLAKELFQRCDFFTASLSAKLAEIPAGVMRLMSTNSALPSPIFPILVHDPTNLEKYLEKNGYSTVAVAYPAVPRDMQRIHVTIHVGNTEADIRKFVNVLVAWAEEQLRVTNKL